MIAQKPVEGNTTDYETRVLLERHRQGWPTLCDQLFAGRDSAWGRAARRKAEILAGLGHGDYLAALNAGARATGEIPATEEREGTMNCLPARAILDAQQCAKLLAAGLSYSVIKQVEPGYWLTDTTLAATALLEGLAAPEKPIPQSGVNKETP